jgi:hypothetical protein
MFGNKTENAIYANDMQALEVFFRNEFGLTLYPIYGTLLGIVRGHDFITYDNDIDLAYVSNYHTLKEAEIERRALEQECRKRNMLYCPNKKTQGLKLNFQRSSFDIWYSYTDDSSYYLQPFNKIGPKELLYPFSKTYFYDAKLTMPHDCVRILESIYKDWKTPTKKNFLRRR